ncbi:MAG: DDE-type integrase/transposase/recombinase [Nanoarchaeota archaeon]
MTEDKIEVKAKYKFKIIKEFYRSNMSVAEFSNKNSIKRRTLYRWLKNFNDKGYTGLVEKSKRPKKIKQTPEQIQKIIVELSQKIGMGSKSISNTLDPIYKISHSGALKVLRRNGITIEKEKKRWKAFRAPYKNHTWQIDFLGPYSPENLGEISILVVLDDYSRYARSLIVNGYGTTWDVKQFLDGLINELGKPYRILTDNGMQFRKGFDKWCKWRGIKHHKAKVRHPQTMGKVEAVNKTLGRYFRFDFSNLSEGQNKLDCIMEWRNQIHFHSVIKSTPAEAYGLQKDKMLVLKGMAKILNLDNLKFYLSRCAISGFT